MNEKVSFWSIVKGMTKLVSIIIPALNEEELIERVIDSIHAQDYRPIEVLIIDGGSKDNTIEIINKKISILNNEDFSIRLYHEKDFGELRSPANAKNIGIEHSKGEYIIFLDADIYFIEKESIEKIKEELDISNFTCVLTEPLIDTDLEQQIAMDYSNVHWCGYRKEIFKKLKLNLNLGFGEDRDFLLRSNVDKNHICETTLGRHYPHTKEELRNQSEWYGRTILKYLRIIHPYKREFLRQSLYVAYNLAVFAVPILFFGFLFFVPLISIVLLLPFIFYYTLKLIKSPVKNLARLKFIIWYHLFTGFYFSIGLFLSLLKRR